MDDEKPAIEVEDREVDPAEAQARREQWQLHSRQRALLLDLVEQETLPSWVLIHLIRMGIIVADETDALPCEYHERNSHWTNWDNDLRAYRERAKQAASEGKWQEPPRSWREQLERSPPSPYQCVCPFESMAMMDDEYAPSPCVRVRAQQRTAPPYLEDPVKMRVLDDPADPVNELHFHPCRVLGLVLLDGIWGTLGRREYEAEQRRWPMGKPKA